MDADFDVLAGGAVAISGEKIEKVWMPANGEPLPDAKETINADGMLVMPGLVNAHTHSPMSLFRGLAERRSWSEWKWFGPTDSFTQRTTIRIAPFTIGYITKEERKLLLYFS